MARGEDKLAGIASAIEAEGGKALAVPAEVAKATDIAAAFDKIRRELGEVDAPLYNAAMWPFGKLMATKPSNVREYLAGECIRRIYRGAGSGAGDAEKRQWRAHLYRRDGGGETVSDFGRIRAGQVRAARSWASDGSPSSTAGNPCRVRGNVDGAIDMPFIRERFPQLTEDDMLKPSAIAETYSNLAHQDRSVWSHEVDVRPYKEKW